MYRKSFHALGGTVLLLSMVLSACRPAATPSAVAVATTEAVTRVPAATTRAPAATTPAPATPTPAAAATTAVAAATTPAAGGAFTPMSVSAPDCNYGGELKTIQAIDPYTVKFSLCKPDPAFDSKAAFIAMAIQEKAYLDANNGDSMKMSAKPNGTGPYMVQEWARGDHITFVANPNYWRTPPKVKTLSLGWSDEAAQRLLQLQSGMADGMDNPDPQDFDTIKADTTLKLYPRQALNIFYIGFNNTLKPFDNEQVRQAFAMAIDRQRMVEQFYPAGASVAQQFVPPALGLGFTNGLNWYDFNQQQAKTMLINAAFDFHQTLTLSYRNVTRSYLPSPDKVATEIQAELKQIGVNVRLEQMESTPFIDAIAAGQKGFYLLGWGADYPDPTDFYDAHFANPNNKQFGTPYQDLATEIKAAGSIADPAHRQQYYDQANQLIKQHVPLIPIAYGSSATVFTANVHGAYASPLTNELFSVMDNGSNQLVFIQNGEPAALWCSDETDGETLRACDQIYDSLLSYKVGGVSVEPGLASSYEHNADLTEWTFHLRQGVKFTSGHVLDANDVVATYVAQWDAKSPNHKGRTNTFYYFGAFYGNMLNMPPAK